MLSVKHLIDTYSLVAGSVFEKNRAIGIVDEMADAMRPMSEIDGYLPDNAARRIKEKLENRLDEMMNRIQRYTPMKLSGVRQQHVTLSSDNESASLFVNGLKVPYSYFNGKLFAPITLEAKAPAGYSFTGWRIASGSTIQILKNNDTWKFYDKGALSNNNWRNSNFNDASWSSGQAPLGYKMSGVKTTVSYGSDSNQKNPTTYFRKTINLSSTPTRSDIFLLNYEVDDGFVVYVNGREAGRYNMPGGNITFNSFSSSYASDTPLTGTLELSSSLFTSGNNVIAVEIHNNSYTSSDQYWAAELFTTMGSASEGFVSTDPVMTLTSADNAVSLVACYTPLSDAERAAQGITPVRINEVSAQNTIFVNEQFKRNDWLELYNTTSSPIDVEGMYLTDNIKSPKKCKITKGSTQTSTIIPAHGFLIIWCDKLETESQLHASFKLDNNSGHLMLTAADESWSDQFVYTRHNGDQSVGRYPDGAADVFVMNIPTIEKPNIKTSYLIDVEQPNITAVQGVRNNPANTNNAIYNLSGQRVDDTYRGIVIRNGRKVMQ